MTAAGPLPSDCAEKFLWQERIAKGGFGAIHLALHRELGRQVAIKVMMDSLAKPDQIQRFIDEARITASIVHRNVVQVLDSGVGAGIPWIAFEYLPGRSLRDIIDKGALPFALALTIVAQVAEALEAVHAREVLHRDVKPDNILEVEEGWFKVVDFGIAKWSQVSATRTDTGVILGTPSYIAPEQILGKPATVASDIYSLGITLFELIAGELPFRDPSIAGLCKQHLNAPIPSVRRRCPAAPPSIDRVLERALQKSPDDRYSSMELFGRDVQRILDGKTLQAIVLDQTSRVPRGVIDRAASSPPPDGPPARRASNRPVASGRSSGKRGPDEATPDVGAESEEIETGARTTNSAKPARSRSNSDRRGAEATSPRSKSPSRGQSVRPDKPVRRRRSFVLIVAGVVISLVFAVTLTTVLVNQFELAGHKSAAVPTPAPPEPGFEALGRLAERVIKLDRKLETEGRGCSLEGATDQNANHMDVTTPGSVKDVTVKLNDLERELQAEIQDGFDGTGIQKLNFWNCLGSWLSNPAVLLEKRLELYRRLSRWTPACLVLDDYEGKRRSEHPLVKCVGALIPVTSAILPGDPCYGPPEVVIGLANAGARTPEAREYVTDEWNKKIRDDVPITKTSSQYPLELIHRRVDWDNWMSARLMGTKKIPVHPRIQEVPAMDDVELTLNMVEMPPYSLVRVTVPTVFAGKDADVWLSQPHQGWTRLDTHPAKSDPALSNVAPPAGARTRLYSHAVGFTIRFPSLLLPRPLPAVGLRLGGASEEGVGQLLFRQDFSIDYTLGARVPNFPPETMHCYMILADAVWTVNRPRSKL